MHLRVRTPRTKLCLSLLRLRTRPRSRSSSCQLVSASASPLARVKGEMGRFQRRLWAGRLFQLRVLWHQVPGLMRNPSCLQTPRSAPRRRGRAIVAVVAKSGPCSFVLWQRLAAVHAVLFTRGILALSSSDHGLHTFADPPPSKQV